MKDEEVMKRLCFPCVGERHGNEETLDFWPTPCLSNMQPRFHLTQFPRPSLLCDIAFSVKTD